MAALLLKQEQQESFERVWSISSDMPFEWLNININDWCEAARLIVNDRVLSVEPLKEQISSDQYYDISKSIMQNCMQLLSDKGEYFKILSDTVLFNCFDMTPQWLNVEIYNEEGENRNTLIGCFHENKSSLFKNHNGNMLWRIQNKANDEKLRAILDSKMSREYLPLN